MASFLNKTITGLWNHRLRAIEGFKEAPYEVQSQQFQRIAQNQNKYIQQFGDITTIERFQQQVPIVDYDTLLPHIERVQGGERDVLWGGSPTKWAAKSSGTTNSVSKYIPITHRYLQKCHLQGGRDTTAIFARNFPNSKAFTGKTMTLGGSSRVEREGGLKTGDLSAILIENVPWPVSMLRVPATKVALIADFEEKVEAICRTTVGKNVTSFAGVPSWNLVLMQKVLEYTGRSSIEEVWPDMSLFIHGGISFEPYRAQYHKIFRGDDMQYMETYNASEGFFAIQEDPNEKGMLLMLDYDVFYEFLPLCSLHDHSTAVPLEGVQLGVNYAMIISNSAGLYRYMIGDTVEFTSVSPYRIRITGRTKSYINVFGEEVIVDNAEKALRMACERTGAEVEEYTAAPIFMEGKQKGAHEWVIECRKEPSDRELFSETLDNSLQQINSDYGAKRHKNTTLRFPRIHFVARGTFTNWMKRRGKQGGQNKVPRLSNTREHVESILSDNEGK